MKRILRNLALFAACVTALGACASDRPPSQISPGPDVGGAPSDAEVAEGEWTAAVLVDYIQLEEGSDRADVAIVVTMYDSAGNTFRTSTGFESEAPTVDDIQYSFEKTNRPIGGAYPDWDASLGRIESHHVFLHGRMLDNGRYLLDYDFSLGTFDDADVFTEHFGGVGQVEVDPAIACRAFDAEPAPRSDSGIQFTDEPPYADETLTESEFCARFGQAPFFGP